MVRRLLLFLCLLTPGMPAQQLAHPGWRGNSIAPEAWWRHTTAIRFGADTTFAAVEESLGRVADVGADTLILPDVAPPAAGAQPFAERFGTEEELDALLHEASARRMHVLLAAPLSRLAANAGEVRFWMNRGVAGFDLGAVSQADAAALTPLRASLDRFPGERVLLAHVADAAAVPVVRGRHAAVVPKLPVLRVAVGDGADAAEFVAVDAAGSAVGSLIPLLLTPGQPIFDSRLLATESGRGALHDAMVFRNAHPALRTGAKRLTVEGVRAWVAAGKASPALIVIENPMGAAVTLHLKAALASAGQRAGYLRPLLRTDGGMGPVYPEGSVLPAGAMVIAEIH